MELGHNMFYTKGFENFNIPLYLSDATQGVNIRPGLPSQLEKSVCFPKSNSLSKCPE
jgi:beta-glucosidase